MLLRYCRMLLSYCRMLLLITLGIRHTTSYGLSVTNGHSDIDLIVISLKHQFPLLGNYSPLY